VPTLVASSGPQFFADNHLSGDGADQARTKAAALARLMRAVEWAAFAPTVSDLADGTDQLAKLSQISGATPMVEGAASPAPWSTLSVRDVGGLRVGFLGVTSAHIGASVDGGETTAQAVREAFNRAKAAGAQVVVALVSVGRGQAKRIADAVPELLAVVVGSANSTGGENTVTPDPERVGDVLIVQAANHLQAAAVLDLYVREPIATGTIARFSDGSDIEKASERSAVSRRRDELRIKISGWQHDPSVLPADIEARRRELSSLDVEIERLTKSPSSIQGNFYRIAIEEIRETLGSDPSADRELKAYYKTVNEHNRIAFAGRMPVSASPSEASYVGGDVCSGCHPAAREVWSRTAHSSAYGTLERESKEFNLDCVSCHVTGYEMPGGSSVTHVELLKNVQCESCHGPGSKHASSPLTTNIIAAPAASTCLECHRPPHVEHFDPVLRMRDILGPGHGQSAPHN